MDTEVGRLASGPELELASTSYYIDLAFFYFFLQGIVINIALAQCLHHQEVCFTSDIVRIQVLKWSEILSTVLFIFAFLPAAVSQSYLCIL